MTHQHNHDNFLPSPFPVVTAYENRFIEEFNNNIAGAVAEVLKYVARATAFTIKNDATNKAEEDELEKAHNVGDIHPNGKWVWTEYAPGKFDWRTSKKTQTKTVAIPLWQSIPAIQKAKTIQECLKVLDGVGAVNLKYCDLTGCNLETAKRVCNVIYNAHTLLGMDKIAVKTQKTLKSATAQASGGRLVELNLQYFSAFNSARYYRDCTENYHQNLLQNVKRLEALEKQLKKSGKYDPVKGKQLTNKIKLAKEKLAKFPCWTTGGKETACEDVVIHELGHILNAQCSGGCGVMSHWRLGRKHTTQYMDMCDRLNQEHYNLFQRYQKEKSVISEYSVSKRAECFAECFVAYIHGDPKLPNYMRDFFKKYFANTTPKNLL